jgi:hypothetical protein
MAVDKDTPCTMLVTISISDGTEKSSVTVEMPKFRAEHAQLAFRLANKALGEVGRDIAVLDLDLFKQVGDVTRETVN